MIALISVAKHALMITAFVSVMMLVIEYINVLTQGQWQERIGRRHCGREAGGDCSACEGLPVQTLSCRGDAGICDAG